MCIKLIVSLYKSPLLPTTRKESAKSHTSSQKIYLLLVEGKNASGNLFTNAFLHGTANRKVWDDAWLFARLTQ